MLERTGERSVTSQARRAQIVAAAIDVIAGEGYRQATFARIADRAGLSSTRLISYHFKGKDDLIRAVVAGVYTDLGQFMQQKLRDHPTMRGALAAYIHSLVDYIAVHQRQMQALLTVFLEHRFEDQTPSYDSDSERRATAALEEILRTGQRNGEFRRFDIFVMATTIQRALDGIPFLLRVHTDLDLDRHASELATLFDLATRREATTLGSTIGARRRAKSV